MNKVYSIVQDKIVSKIEEAIENGGVAPWKKPWRGGIPKNYVTGKHYRGINLVLLDGGSYITFNQIKDLQKKNPEVKLKKGSKHEKVVFWNFVERENEDGEDDSYSFLKYYRVFPVSCVEGLDDSVEVFDNDPIEDAENLIESYRQEVSINIKTSNRAYYVPALDRIVCPTINQFERPEEYYSTLLHEMIHSTGHESRLNRFDGKDNTIFGSESYSKEELVAEIGSNMMMSILGIESEEQEDNSISYLYGWLTKIKEDPKLIVHASQRAQKACDLILEYREDMSVITDEIFMVE